MFSKKKDKKKVKKKDTKVKVIKNKKKARKQMLMNEYDNGRILKVEVEEDGEVFKKV